MKFTDGMEIDTSGEYRVIRKSDGLYVVGHGFLCAIDNQEEGDAMIARLSKRKPESSDERVKSSSIQTVQSNPGHLGFRVRGGLLLSYGNARSASGRPPFLVRTVLVGAIPVQLGSMLRGAAPSGHRFRRAMKVTLARR